MPDIKTFRAETMNEALHLVRQELGPDAFILHTRQIPIKSLFPWQKERFETEIVALAGEETPSSKTQQSKPFQSIPSYSKRQQIASEASLRQRSNQPPVSNSRSRFSGENSMPTSRVTENRIHTPTSAAEPLAPGQPTLERSISEVPTSEAPKTEEAKTESARLERLVNERLDALQNMVEQLTQQVQSSTSPNMPPELFDVYTELIDSDIEDDLARELITRLRHRCSQEDLEHPERIRAYLLGMVESQINSREAIKVTPGQQKVVALVGPTGVGKTTTIAKLAANFRLRDNIRMGLITVDTYRIAAVEQLRTYADIIDLPMKVVTTPREMKQAVEELSQMDLILIDTAGRSPQDDLRIQELKNYLSEIVVDEVHLVLSATTGYRHLKKTVEKFSAVKPTSVIFTKLDEAPGLGSLVNVCGKLGQSLSYLTTGQNVPNDIEPAEPTRTANLVLGYERIET